MKMTAEQRSDMMLHAPVSRVIPRLAIPTIFSMLMDSNHSFISWVSTSCSASKASQSGSLRCTCSTTPVTELTSWGMSSVKSNLEFRYEHP